MIETKIKGCLTQLIATLGILIGNAQILACDTVSVAPHQDERQGGFIVQYMPALPASQLKPVAMSQQTNSEQVAKMAESSSAGDFTVALLAAKVPHIPNRLPRVSIKKISHDPRSSFIIN